MMDRSILVLSASCLPIKKVISPNAMMGKTSSGKGANGVLLKYLVKTEERHRGP
jgi:hypothetical protein